MKTAIVGYGIVGKATHYSVLLDSPDVAIFDINNIQELSQTMFDLIFICVPTANHRDTQELKRIGDEILSRSNAYVFIRSSLPIGFIQANFPDYLDRIVYFPEFLRERKWKEDSAKMPWIFGCTNKSTVEQLLKLANTDNQKIVLELAEAEILKMMNNSYASLRVVFANHLYDLSQSFDVDYSAIKNAFKSVEHRDQDYFDVNENLRGFGGKCLPKDLDFLIESFDHQQIPQMLFSAIKNDNKKWPITVRQDV